MDRREFEALVGRELDAIPAEFADRLADVVVLVKREPLPRDVQKHGRDGELLGLYRGVPLTRRRVRGRGSIARMPDVITIYQGPLERACVDDPDGIPRLIERTLLREVARYFGITTERLEELGFDAS